MDVGPLPIELAEIVTYWRDVRHHTPETLDFVVTLITEMDAVYRSWVTEQRRSSTGG